MARPPLLARIVARLVRARLRRSAGTRGITWAVRIPLVTLAVFGIVVVARRTSVR